MQLWCINLGLLVCFWAHVRGQNMALTCNWPPAGSWTGEQCCCLIISRHCSAWQNTTCLDTYGLSNPDLPPTQTQIRTHSPLCVSYFYSSIIVLLIWHVNIFLTDSVIFLIALTSDEVLLAPVVQNYTEKQTQGAISHSHFEVKMNKNLT